MYYVELFALFPSSLQVLKVFCKSLYGLTSLDMQQLIIQLGCAIMTVVTFQFSSLLALRTSSMVSSYRPVSLGLPVTFMKKCCDQIQQTAELYSQARLKLQNLMELTSEELREVYFFLFFIRFPNIALRIPIAHNFARD